MGSSGDPVPVLISDPIAEAGKAVHQLLFYDSETEKISATSDTTLTSYASDNSPAASFPTPDTGYHWMNGGTEFTASTLVTSDLQLIKTVVTSPGGGTSTPTMTGITVPDITTQPSFAKASAYTVYLRITAYSFDLASYLSGDSATDASVSSLDLTDTLSANSFSSFSIDSLDDSYGLLAESDNAPEISDSGVFSCYLNYAAKSPSGQTATGTAADTETLNETADTASTESSSNSNNPTASADSTLNTTDNYSDTVMLSATLIINVTLASGEIAPVTLDIEVPQRLYNIDYRTHIQSIGWEDTFVENGKLSGAEGR
ncbi:hypothetical protein Q5O14_02240 [Eubacteriaceae bacterium ES2]|nr:hypothetical protein Q5O14_02240 [Eubacteriaceae bacterium ES2]